MAAILAFLLASASASVTLGELDQTWTQLDEKAAGLRETWEFRSNLPNFGSGIFSREVNEGQGRIRLKTDKVDIEVRVNERYSGYLDRSINSMVLSTNSSTAGAVLNRVGLFLGTRGSYFTPKYGIESLQLVLSNDTERMYEGSGSYNSAPLKVQVTVDGEGALVRSNWVWGADGQAESVVFERQSRSASDSPQIFASTFSKEEFLLRDPNDELPTLPTFVEAKSPSKVKLGTPFRLVLAQADIHAFRAGPSIERWITDYTDPDYGQRVYDSFLPSTILRDWPRYRASAPTWSLLCDGRNTYSKNMPNGEAPAHFLLNTAPGPDPDDFRLVRPEDRGQLKYASGISRWNVGAGLVSIERDPKQPSDVVLVFENEKGDGSRDFRLTFAGDSWDLHNIKFKQTRGRTTLHMERKRSFFERGFEFAENDFRPDPKELASLGFPVWFAPSQ